MTRHWLWTARLTAGLTLPALLWAKGAAAQLQPVADETLGAEQSLVTPSEFNGVPGHLITEGAQRGANLFHSFQEFSIDEGQAAYFATPDGVANILGRVTGGSQSDIFGRLGVLGEANLFLINPNGILFGPNASLDIGGSFLATTADAIGFGEQGWFSAATPEAPSPLLTINPSAFFYNQMQTSPITVRSTTPVDPDLETTGLAVGVGENLALLGGDITVEGRGRLNARGGRIDLGAVASSGTIGLNADGSFAFPTDVQRGDIVFAESARADVRTPTSGGAMALTAQGITITGGSQLRAGTLIGRGEPGGQIGDIELDATEQILVTQSSRIQNAVASDSLGNAGNVVLITPILEVLDGARLSASTFGQGNGGSVIIMASDLVTFNDGDAFSQVGANGIGDGGDIKITAPILEVLEDGSTLSVRTHGRGNAGNVIITASDRVTFNGGAAFSDVIPESIGGGGNIEITTPILEVLDGAQLHADTFGRRVTGSVLITASDRVTLSTGFVLADDIEITAPVLEVRDGARLLAGAFGRRNDGKMVIIASDHVTFKGRNTHGAVIGGDIEITAPVLEVRDGAGLSASALGQSAAGSVIISATDRVTFNDANILSTSGRNNLGNGGNIEIAAPILEVLNGAELRTNALGRGNVGNVVITASNRVTFQGESQNGDVSAAYSSILTDEFGQGGDIKITAPIVEVLDGAGLVAGTRGRGDSGNIIITASDRVTFQGESRNGPFRSAAFTNVDTEGDGAGGDIEITAPVLEVLDGAFLSVSTRGQGDSGNVIITAHNRVTFQGESTLGIGSTAISSVEPGGDGAGGGIKITAPILEVLDGAVLSASTFGRGNAGSMIITASDRVTFSNGGALSRVQSNGIGNGGDIKIIAPVLEVLDGAALSASTFGRGNAGSVIITASDHVTFNDGEAFSSVRRSGIGNGGDIKITAPVLEVLDGAALSASTFGRGNAGSVIITASDHVIFRGGRAFSSVSAGGDGEGDNVEITTPVLEVLDGSQLVASTFGRGNAGSVIITASDHVLVDGVNSRGSSSGLFSTTLSDATGEGRDVIITTPQLLISNGALIDAGTTSAQPGGNIVINAGQVHAVGGGQVVTSTAGAGRAGNILINAEHIQISGRDFTFAQRLERFGRGRTENEGNGESGIFASTRPDSTGASGEIILDAAEVIVDDYAQISTQSQGTGAAGNMRIQAEETIALDRHASINSDTNGDQGNIDLSTGLLLLRDNSTITTNASGPGIGGNIDIEADFIVAAANENSDIFANAVEGSGGQITLTAQAIFGLEFRTRDDLQEILGDDPSALTPRNLPSNDVTAFSQSNPTIDLGTVTFQTPNIDPSQGLVELPSVPLAAADQILQVCLSGGRRTAMSLQNEFVVTGRGGLPANPLAPLQGDGILAGWASLDDDESNTEPIALPEQPMEMGLQQTIVEATSWRRDAEGNVVLMAAAGISHLPPSNPGHCL